MFRLQLPTDINTTRTPPKLEEVPQDVKRFKSEWGNNAICLSELVGQKVFIEQSSECKVKRILLPAEECERVSHIVRELHFITTRVFLLFGTIPHHTVVRVHAVALPSQSFTANGLKLNDKEKSSAVALAESLGLKLVGAIVNNDKKQPPVSPASLLELAKLANGDHFTIVTAIPDAGMCHFEAFQMSQQFLELARTGFFVGCDDTRLTCKDIATVYSKDMKDVDVSYFLVNVAVKTRQSWFPRCRFPYQALYPSCGDFAECMAKDFEAPDFVRVLDFNMLLYLESKFGGIEHVVKVAQMLTEKKNLPFEILRQLDELIECAGVSN